MRDTLPLSDLHNQILLFIPVNGEFANVSREAQGMVDVTIRGGETADDARALIDITPSQKAFLLKLTRSDVLRRKTVERAIVFRAKVRRSFDRRWSRHEQQTTQAATPYELQPIDPCLSAPTVVGTRVPRPGDDALSP